MRTVISCPLCEWLYEVPRLNPVATHPSTLASVFGPGTFAVHAINSHNERVERALEEHFKVHTTAQWLAKVTQLQRQVDQLNERMRAWAP